MQDLAYEMNLAAARLARAACDAMTERTPDRPRFVAGALGPTNRTASISPDVNDPGARNVTYDELVEAYLEQARGLVDGGADLLLIETIFDTLNAKAAIFALETLFEERGAPLAGDDLGHHHRRLRPHPVRAGHRGVLELGPARAAARRRAQLRARRRRDAALPRRDRPDRRLLRLLLPERRAAQRVRRVRRDARADGRDRAASSPSSGLVNIVGGCCGTTPEHIAAMAARRSTAAPRACRRDVAPALRLSGLEPLTIDRDSLFVNVGERTNITGSARFRRPDQGRRLRRPR